EAGALGIVRGGEELLLQLFHAVVVGLRLGRIGAIAATLREPCEERAFRLFRADAEIGFRQVADPVAGWLGAVGREVRGVRVGELSTARKQHDRNRPREAAQVILGSVPAGTHVRARAVHDVERLPLDVAKLDPDRLTVALGSRREQLFLELVHALVVWQRLRRGGPVAACAPARGGGRGFGLLWGGPRGRPRPGAGPA